MIIGPRIGKYNRDGSSNAMPGHDIVIVLTGCFILAFGWFGFNPGSTLGASGALAHQHDRGRHNVGRVYVVCLRLLSNWRCRHSATAARGGRLMWSQNETRQMAASGRIAALWYKCNN